MRLLSVCRRSATRPKKFAAKVFTTIEWGTQHWKLQETFPVPVIPRWLRMPEFTQTTTPLRGELPLMPTGGHFEDIRVRCLAMWSWMAVLLQYWQDHMTPHLYGGRFLASATWRPPSSGTSTHGSHTRRILVGGTWP